MHATNFAQVARSPSWQGRKASLISTKGTEFSNLKWDYMILSFRKRVCCRVFWGRRRRLDIPPECIKYPIAEIKQFGIPRSAKKLLLGMTLNFISNGVISVSMLHQFDSPILDRPRFTCTTKTGRFKEATWVWRMKQVVFCRQYLPRKRIQRGNGHTRRARCRLYGDASAEINILHKSDCPATKIYHVRIYDIYGSVVSGKK